MTSAVEVRIDPWSKSPFEPHARSFLCFRPIPAQTLGVYAFVAWVGCQVGSLTLLTVICGDELAHSPIGPENEQFDRASAEQFGIRSLRSRRRAQKSF